jgi:hypothetical protein
MPTPMSLDRPARSAPARAKASRKVKIGAVETRIPVSDEAMCSWPNEISVSGAAAWTSPSTTTGPSRPRSSPSTPMCRAIGTSTSVASTVRIETTAQGASPSSSATSMNMYEEPQRADSVRNIASARRDTARSLADGSH